MTLISNVYSTGYKCFKARLIISQKISLLLEKIKIPNIKYVTPTTSFLKEFRYYKLKIKSYFDLLNAK